MKDCEFLHAVSQPYKQKLTGDDPLKQIFAGKYFGAVVCDIHVPENLKTDFAEMPPIFKNVELSIEDVGPFMKNLCQNLGEFKTLQQSLIRSYFRHQVVAVSLLLRSYCAHGLIVDNVTAFVRYKPVPCFCKFTEKVAATRCKADDDKPGTAAGNAAKLIGELNI